MLTLSDAEKRVRNSWGVSMTYMNSGRLLPLTTDGVGVDLMLYFLAQSSGLLACLRKASKPLSQGSPTTAES